MNFNGNTVLITGGSSGIGLELAKVLVEKGNTVIICGRSEEKLEAAKVLIPSLLTFQCDLSIESECVKLRDWIVTNYPVCNVLINNAAIVHKTDFYTDDNIISKANCEIRTNFMAPLILTKLFLPILEKNENSRIIFVTTGLIYVPRAIYPVYCATKAALHSFVKTLRLQLKARSIKIVEVLMPAVDTPFHEGNPPKIAIMPQKAVREMIIKLEKDCLEIKVAGVKILYTLSRIAPAFAFKKINEL